MNSGMSDKARTSPHNSARSPRLADVRGAEERHLCSIPRIVFYVESLRFKRRITTEGQEQHANEHAAVVRSRRCIVQGQGLHSLSFQLASRAALVAGVYQSAL